MSAAEYIDDQEFDKAIPPCRDTRVLTWLTNLLGADMLLDAINSQTGGKLGERMQREQARRRIEELGQQ